MDHIVPLNAKLTKTIGELLSLARAGKLHGIAYVSIIEDADGHLASGTNAVWNGDPLIQGEMYSALKVLRSRIEPKKSALIDMQGNALEAGSVN